MIFLALLIGAAWRRWFGSARPGWAWTGYRATQVIAGLAVLFGIGLLTREPLWRAALDAGLAIGFMTLPIQYSRRPFEIVTEWLVEHGLPTTDRLPHPWKPMLQGPAPYAEALQGATLWGLAVLV